MQGFGIQRAKSDLINKRLSVQIRVKMLNKQVFVSIPIFHYRYFALIIKIQGA